MKNIAISLIALSVIILVIAGVAKINHWQGADTLLNLSLYAIPLLGINVFGLLILWVKDNLAVRKQR